MINPPRAPNKTDDRNSNKMVKIIHPLSSRFQTIALYKITILLDLLQSLKAYFPISILKKKIMQVIFFL